MYLSTSSSLSDHRDLPRDIEGYSAVIIGIFQIAYLTSLKHSYHYTIDWQLIIDLFECKRANFVMSNDNNSGSNEIAAKRKTKTMYQSVLDMAKDRHFTYD